eukprot:6176093-Pleurochrysis_carterae.AAC.2
MLHDNFFVNVCVQTAAGSKVACTQAGTMLLRKLNRTHGLHLRETPALSLLSRAEELVGAGDLPLSKKRVLLRGRGRVRAGDVGFSQPNAG